MKKFFVLTALAVALTLGIVHESEAGLFGRLRARRGGGCARSSCSAASVLEGGGCSGGTCRVR